MTSVPVRVVSGTRAPAAVERLLRALPDWFGIEESIVEYVSDAARLPTYLAYAAADPNSPAIGVLLVRRHFPESAEIHLMAVDPSLHRRGVGHALLAAAEADLRSEGVRFLQVKTQGPSRPDEDYARTTRFYVAEGFVPLEEIVGLWAENPCLILVKSLGDAHPDRAAASVRMHEDELEVDAGLVRRLVAGQFPQWAGLPVRPVASAGTDNALHRLGDDMVVRMPRVSWAVDDVDLEQQWLPFIAPHLPIDVPLPLGRGGPADGYPWSWSVYRWLDGENPVLGQVADPTSLATGLARFVTALQTVDATPGPRAGRGGPLQERDEPTREAIEALRGMVDTAAATAAWDEALRAPAWAGPPVWVHGDLSPGNLLVTDGRLSAVIDFGAMGVGDPAVDLIVGWNLLPPGARALFRSQLDVDEASWARGRGWALSIALIQLPYYHRTNPALADNARHVIGEVLADHRAP